MTTRSGRRRLDRAARAARPARRLVAKAPLRDICTEALLPVAGRRNAPGGEFPCRCRKQVAEAIINTLCPLILFCGNRDPAEIGADQIRAFLENLAMRGHVSDYATTTIYTQVLNRGGQGVCCPLDGPL